MQGYPQRFMGSRPAAADTEHIIRGGHGNQYQFVQPILSTTRRYNALFVPERRDAVPYVLRCIGPHKEVTGALDDGFIGIVVHVICRLGWGYGG